MTTQGDDVARAQAAALTALVLGFRVSQAIHVAAVQLVQEHIWQRLIRRRWRGA